MALKKYYYVYTGIYNTPEYKQIARFEMAAKANLMDYLHAIGFNVNGKYTSEYFTTQWKHNSIIYSTFVMWDHD